MICKFCNDESSVQYRAWHSMPLGKVFRHPLCSTCLAVLLQCHDRALITSADNLEDLDLEVLKRML